VNKTKNDNIIYVTNFNCYIEFVDYFVLIIEVINKYL